MKSIPLAVLCLGLAGVPAAAEEEHRELGAHEHGHATLDIAIEGKRVVMELEAPGHDIMGFEHAPENREQKAALKNAKAVLTKPLAIFKLPPDTGCKVTKSKVEVHTEDHDEDAHENEDHAKAKEQHADHHEDKDGRGHTEFHANFALECEKPAALTSIAFDYFKRFAGANSVTVNIVTDKAQNKYNITRESPVLDLSGIM
jgi:Protein of unknown function (DUF2796)